MKMYMTWNTAGNSRYQSLKFPNQLWCCRGWKENERERVDVPSSS